MKNSLIYLTLATLFLGGCTYPEKNMTIQKPAEPDWLLNPTKGLSRRAAVGCAYIHAKGESAQKKLAVARAIEQIAMQKSTNVDVVTYRKRSQSSGRLGSSTAQTSSLQSVSNINIKTIVKAYYKKSDGQICAWVVEK